MLNFGFILADQGKVAEGVEQLRKAVALKPQQARLLCGLVQLLGKSKAEGAAEELAAARKQVEGAGANCQRERNPLDGYGDVKE